EGCCHAGGGADADNRKGAGRAPGWCDGGRLYVSRRVRETTWNTRSPNPRLPFGHDALLAARRAHSVTHPSIERKELGAHAARTRHLIAETRRTPMPSLAKTSSALCLANREIVARSRRLSRASRRLLNPAWALSGGSADDDLSGSTRMCFVCDEPMLLGVACEISGPEGSVFAHFVCSRPSLDGTPSSGQTSHLVIGATAGT